MNPEISVIIPTCQRNEALLRSLAALERQTLSRDAFEVIVIVDGDAADTREALEKHAGTLALRHFGQATSGAAQARNKGAEVATGRILLFLDDDIEAEEGLLSAHLDAASGGECVGAGNLVTRLPKRVGLLGAGLRIWWERKLEEMRREGHRFSYLDLLSGHFSIPVKTFGAIGGFDPAYKCREDYEFGARLIKARIPFRFVAGSVAVHHETESLRKGLDRARNEGFADVHLARRHPELVSSLAASDFCNPDGKPSAQRRVMEHLVEKMPGVIEWLMARIELWRMRGLWQKLYLALRRRSYLKGVHAACPDPTELKRLFPGRGKEQKDAVVAIDLRKGIRAAEADLDKLQPATARLVHGDCLLGTMPPGQLAENLGGRHLGPFIKKSCPTEFLVAMALHRMVKCAEVEG